MSIMNLEKINHEVNILCQEVGAYIEGEQHRIRQKDIDSKGLHDYVTRVDKLSEEKLVDSLSKILPGSGFLVEENTVKDSRREFTWVVDPLDGTTNYIHGLPVFSISVALVHDKRVISGTVYDVRAKECFHAREGGPAFVNKEEIRVSSTSSLAESLLATGFPFRDFERQKDYLRLLGHLMQNTRGIRRFGSAAIDLAWVARGRFDAFWEYGLKPWDVAAGSFIVQQAGGKCSDFSGGNSYLSGEEILCGNARVYHELLEAVQQNMTLKSK